MDLKEIKAIIDLMTKNGLTEFELQKGEVKLRVKRGPNGEWTSTSVPSGAPTGTQPLPQIVVAPPLAVAAPAVTAPAPASPVAAASPAAGLSQIISPMVGTFYRSPSPDSPPYIDAGQEVNEETVVCIIEAMKVMNEIKAECTGVIVEVLAQNGKPVDFGKPLFSVRPK
jgi:acetyl-CoA carboxylase biotin carboxyl carrier protein